MGNPLLSGYVQGGDACMNVMIRLDAEAVAQLDKLRDCVPGSPSRTAFARWLLLTTLKQEAQKKENARANKN